MGSDELLTTVSDWMRVGPENLLWAPTHGAVTNRGKRVCRGVGARRDGGGLGLARVRWDQSHR